LNWEEEVMHAAVAFFLGICVVIGALLLLAAISGSNYSGLSIQTEVALAVIALVIAILAAWILYTGLAANLAKIKTGKEALIGSRGIVITDLKPKGEIRIMGEFWQATVKDKWVTNGEKVEVVDMDGMLLVVEPADSKA
jgi:membrane-bound serine protease (ClpP class)